MEHEVFPVQFSVCVAGIHIFKDKMPNGEMLKNTNNY